jgi:hypothetical protein
MSKNILFISLILFILANCQISGDRSFATPRSAIQEPTPSSGSPKSEGYVIHNDRWYIAPGSGTKEVRLNASKQELVDALGEPNEGYDYDKPSSDNCGPFSDMHWIEKPDNDIETNEGEGIYCFLREGKSFQISFSGPFYATKGNVSFYSSLQDVKKVFPTIKVYVMTRTADKINGNNDLLYAISKEEGIAFELFYDTKKKMRSVWKIYVFQPDSDFIPNVCPGKSQQLQLWQE